jgi:hypothetical protein
VRRLALILILSAAVFAQDAGVRLPFVSRRSLILVQVGVEGQTLTMIFDSGAERTMINSKANVERVKPLAVGSRVLRMPLLYVDMNGMKLEEVRADGVLGQDVLRQFKSVTIDYKESSVLLD